MNIELAESKRGDIARIHRPEPMPSAEGGDLEIFEPSWLCSKAVVFLDTSILLQDDSLQFIEQQLVPALQFARRHATVLSRSIDHLQSLRDGQGTEQQAKSATRALTLLARMQQARVVCDVADTHAVTDDPHGTARLFAEMFVRYQLQATQCLITQDEMLAIQTIRNSRSLALDRSHPVLAAYVANGQLHNWACKLDDSEYALSVPASRHPKKVSAEELTKAGTRVIADTSALMLADHETGAARGARFFEHVLLPRMRESSVPLFVPSRVMSELGKHQNSNDPERSKLAHAALAVLRLFSEADRLVVGEDKQEVQGGSATFADPVFVELMIRFQGQFDLCFITQDRELARTLLANRSQNSKSLSHVTFVPMKDKADLMAWETRIDGELNASAVRTIESNQRKIKRTTTHSSNKLPRGASAPQTTRSPEAFELATKPRPIDNTPLPIQSVVSTGDTAVGAHSGSFVLGEVIAAGGEGTIYATPLEGLVCKIYHRERLTRGRLEKLELMLSREVRIHGVCWPTELVTTADGQFQGYLMPKASGRTLRTCVFGKPLLKRHFPLWTRLELTELAMTVLGTFRALHRINVFIGDINAMNILVQDQHNVSLVDMDSVQIGGFPCPVGTETFTPPERQGLAYTDFLRSKNDELFAVTTLIWQILLPGNAPYSSQGGGEVAENIRNRRFAYGPDREGRPPVGAWGNIWSHLPYQLRLDFVKVFRDGKRVSIANLQYQLAGALTAMREHGANSEIFPTEPRRSEGIETVKLSCDKCGGLFDVSKRDSEFRTEKGWTYRCRACSDIHKLTHLESTREVDCALRISPQCEIRYPLPITIIEEFQANRRSFACRPCRELRRAQGGSHSYPRHLNHRRNTVANSSSCFVATAAYQGIDKPEVRFLRLYRDAVLQKSFVGRAFVRWYYVVGPWLAKPVRQSTLLQRSSKYLLDGLVQRLARQQPDLATITGVKSNGS